MAAEAARKGDLATARRLYEEALRQDPQNGPVALELARTLAAMGEGPAAESLLVRLVASVPDRPEPRRTLAIVYLQNGKALEAVAQAREAVKREPDDAEGHFLLGSALRATGQPAEAVPELQKAVSKSTRPAPALHQLALAYAQLGEPKADETFARVLALEPNNQVARFDYASYLWQIRSFDRGNREMDRLLKSAPNDLALRRKYASQLLEEGRFEKAAGELALLWKSGERDYDVAHYYGMALAESGRTEEGVLRLRDAVAADPNRLAAHHTLGRVLYRGQRPQEAVAEFERAAALQPDSAGIRLELGLACEAAGQPDKAEAAYREALRLDPKLAKAHYTLGTLLARTGRREEGASHAVVYQAAFAAEQQATILGASRKAELNLGWVALENGEPEKALEQFERHPDNPTALRGAARALILLGRDAEAFQKYERAVALAPDDLALRHELDREYDRARKK